MSLTGISSVMQTTSFTPAADDSMMASAAKARGTKTPAVSAPVARTASATVSKTGSPRCRVPPLPGETPATTWVPNSIICWV